MLQRQDSFADVSDSASDYKLDVRISDWLDENELSEFKDTFNKEQVILQQLAGKHADRELAEMGMKNLKDRMKTISFARKALEADTSSQGVVDDALSEIIDELWNDCAESNGDSDVSSMQHESRKVKSITQYLFNEKRFVENSAEVSQRGPKEDQILNRLKFLEESLQALQHGNQVQTSEMLRVPKLDKHLSNSAGIGIRIDADENGIYKIIGMKAGGPADRAFPALQNGDAILSIDDQPIAGKSKQELFDLFKGLPGSQVSLEVRKDGKDAQEFTIRLTRE
ncbi:hypothetical protein GUITHDRAFT_112266 [Guillardia theta CCMP2712]|uniref:PDZ domain-containing protein n=1 Tax=Guillardia theta (strain CCMP2712) TaxID=905079 RepID=L1IZ54_GUITC|nr:hypothetical protein GUITHDRAFT_112266 [Guillardia theta CCMP2712]EKX41553.1 hypothetical protein GUITHDRAFT_112266 [Guillardia theta CCMP2712]|eukprot:XP_005828533.1 hypothetical protein GUITHDRAFT_112266 [Guillardia theta CCMP2712]